MDELTKKHILSFIMAMGMRLPFTPDGNPATEQAIAIAHRAWTNPSQPRLPPRFAESRITTGFGLR